MRKVNPSHNISLQSFFLKSQSYLSLVILFICVIGMAIVSTMIYKRYSEYNLELMSKSIANQLIIQDALHNPNLQKEIFSHYMQSYSLESIQLLNAQNDIITNTHEGKSNWLSWLQDAIISNDAGIYRIADAQQQTIATVKVKNNFTPMRSFVEVFLVVFLLSLVAIQLVIHFSGKFMYRELTRSTQKLISATDSIIESRQFDKQIDYGRIDEFNTISERFNILLKEMYSWQQHLERESSHFAYRAMHDPLTKLPNREFFNQKFTELFENQSTQGAFALFFIDNNLFKEINDEYGHLVGDAVLQEMAMRISQVLRPEDFFARLGGDEFAILLPNISSSINALAIGKRILHVSDEPLVLEEFTIPFGFSVGIALSAGVSSQAELLDRADQAMYQAKASRVKRMAIYDPSYSKPEKPI